MMFYTNCVTFLGNLRLFPHIFYRNPSSYYVNILANPSQNVLVIPPNIKMVKYFMSVTKMGNLHEVLPKFKAVGGSKGAGEKL